jgi:hypothetical protein
MALRIHVCSGGGLGRSSRAPEPPRRRMISDSVLNALEQELDLEKMSARRHLDEP